MKEASAVIEHVVRDGEVRAIIVRASFTAETTTFITPPEFSEQLGYMRHPAGTRIIAHHHNPVERVIHTTQEVLFIRSGSLRVDFFDGERYAESRVLGPGDVILLTSGGHGFEVLEDLEMFEVKQGPYVGEGEKTRFDAGPFIPIVKGP